MSDKIYVPGVFAKVADKKRWWELTINCKADELISFIEKHRDERGWIKFGITEKREPNEKSSHSVWLDQWRPDATRQFNNARSAVDRTPAQSQFHDAPNPKPAQPAAAQDDDVPF